MTHEPANANKKTIKQCTAYDLAYWESWRVWGQAGKCGKACVRAQMFHSECYNIYWGHRPTKIYNYNLIRFDYPLDIPTSIHIVLAQRGGQDLSGPTY